MDVKNPERDPRLDSDDSFVQSTKFKNDVNAFLDANPEGTSFANIAQLLKLRVTTVERIYHKAIGKLQDMLGAETCEDEDLGD